MSSNDSTKAPMKKLVPVLCVVSAIGLVASIYLVFFSAPLQWGKNADGRLNASSLFFNQKIFYFHVAHAFVLFTTVFVAGMASIVFLKTRRAPWDDLASAAVDVAVAFGAAVLVTGSVWA